MSLKNMMRKENIYSKNDHRINAMIFASSIAGKAVVKSFFGVDCNDKIEGMEVY